MATVREKISNDGNELIITTASNSHPTQITVWTRSGGVKVAKDLLAGEWTQDLTKTRLSQGMVLKIEPDGNGGVRFSGDFSYTARFDGKQYDLQNSRNDTVTLQLVDSHTVDSFTGETIRLRKRTGGWFQPMGQQMTLTTTGTLNPASMSPRSWCSKEQ